MNISRRPSLPTRADRVHHQQQPAATFSLEPKLPHEPEPEQHAGPAGPVWKFEPLLVLIMLTWSAKQPSLQQGRKTNKDRLRTVHDLHLMLMMLACLAIVWKSGSAPMLMMLPWPSC